MATLFVVAMMFVSHIYSFFANIIIEVSHSSRQVGNGVERPKPQVT